MGMTRYKAKQVEYKGVKLKSKLERSCAVAFDDMGIEWQYEPREFLGCEFPHGYYKPDFYLPGLDIYVEAAGVWDSAHVKKAEALAEYLGYEEGGVQRVLEIDKDGNFRGDTKLQMCEHCGSVTPVTECGVWCCETCKRHTQLWYDNLFELGADMKARNKQKEEAEAEVEHEEQAAEHEPLLADQSIARAAFVVWIGKECKKRNRPLFDRDTQEELMAEFVEAYGVPDGVYLGTQCVNEFWAPRRKARIDEGLRKGMTASEICRKWPYVNEKHVYERRAELKAIAKNMRAYGSQVTTA